MGVFIHECVSNLNQLVLVVELTGVESSHSLLYFYHHMLDLKPKPNPDLNLDS